MSKFKVGDLVAINPESDFYKCGGQPSEGVEGRVEWLGLWGASIVYLVSWGDGWSVYDDEELLLVDSFEGNV